MSNYEDEIVAALEKAKYATEKSNLSDYMKIIFEEHFDLMITCVKTRAIPFAPTGFAIMTEEAIKHIEETRKGAGEHDVF